ncbi:unnamed protein product [Withania somnifera]
MTEKQTKSELKLNYYSESCPRAEEIIKEQVIKLYHKHGNTAASWIRNVFHDCMVKTIKEALESKCPNTESYLAEVENFIPNHNDSMLLVLSRFKSVGVDAQGTVALLGAHSVGRVHCVNIVHVLYPTVDPTLDPDYANYLKTRFRRNDRETPMVWDNLYYKNILSNKGSLIVDQQLKFAASNSYFHSQFGKALIILS